ncbi:MAG: hypothetical protein RLZZ262_712 [Bacteroidota bacterium]|jgi:hypothetical protein
MLRMSFRWCATMLLFGVFFIVGCNQNDNESALVAKIGERELHWDDLTEMIPDNSSPEDSVKLAESYIENWLREQSVVALAESTLGEDQEQIQVLIENYRQSLLTYNFEQQWVQQHLDTNVSEQEVESYYNANNSNFELKDYIVKVKFCALNSDNKQLGALKKMFVSNKGEDFVKWQKLCVETGASSYFSEDNWMRWDELIQQIPLDVYDVEAFLSKNKFIEFSKDNNTYYLSILEYKLRGSVSPLSFERNKIKSMILNKRKIDLLLKMREDVYNQAKQDKKIELYYNKE